MIIMLSNSSISLSKLSLSSSSSSSTKNTMIMMFINNKNIMSSLSTGIGKRRKRVMIDCCDTNTNVNKIATTTTIRHYHSNNNYVNHHTTTSSVTNMNMIMSLKLQQQQQQRRHMLPMNQNRGMMFLSNTSISQTSRTTKRNLSSSLSNQKEISLTTTFQSQQQLQRSFSSLSLSSEESQFQNEVITPMPSSSSSVTTSSSSSDNHTTNTVPATETHRRMNLFTAINDALIIAMRSDDNAILFGEDVAFGGVFRCSQNLLQEFGPHRVFNTPLSENGIIGLAIGYASTDNGIAIAEIQFADYIYPAFDQIVNELAKFRYRSGNQWNNGGVTIRTPCGAVGHGGHYHSQSPEAYLCHTPGIVTVMPSTPATAKGLLLSSIRSKDPVIFLEPKILYRTSIEDVPIHDYEIPLGKARIVNYGTDITLIGYGGQVRIMEIASQYVYEQYQISCEIIDLQTLIPYDLNTIVESVNKTGKCLITHEAPQTCGYGAELCSIIQEHCFYSLQVPIQRVTGYDIPFPLITEKLYIPDQYKIIEMILYMMKQAK